MSFRLDLTKLSELPPEAPLDAPREAESGQVKSQDATSTEHTTQKTTSSATLDPEKKVTISENMSAVDKGLKAKRPGTPRKNGAVVRTPQKTEHEPAKQTKFALDVPSKTSEETKSYATTPRHKTGSSSPVVSSLGHEIGTEPTRILSSVFPNSTPAQLKEIHTRLVNYAELCDIKPEEMFKKIEAGHKVAQAITEGNIEKGHPVDDVINVDWFMRAHMAKQDQLFLKGTAKMADPDGQFAKFILNSKSVLNGKEDDPYGRASTHYPEKGKSVREGCIKAGDEYLAYKSEVAEAKKAECKAKAKETGEPEATVHHLKDAKLLLVKELKSTCIGIDASGENHASMGLAGKDNTTFLFMPMFEKSYDPKTGAPGDPVQVIAWKAEGHSARLPSQGGDLKESVKHGFQAFVKKVLDNPGELDEVPGGVRDLKEDKLNPEILRQLTGFEILEGTEKDIPPETAKRLQDSFAALEATTESHCHCGMQEFKAHLENMLQVPTLSDTQKSKAEALLQTINKYNAASLSISEKYAHPLLPRSEEVVLPTLKEMLADITSFRQTAASAA